MKLSVQERAILRNQYKILSVVDPSEREYYKKLVTILEDGYELEYYQISDPIEQELSEDSCREVRDILQMHDALRLSYRDLKIKPSVSEDDFRFRGFDGNDPYEGRLMAYTRFLMERDGRWEALKPRDYNSHMPMLPFYRSMLDAWRQSEDPHQLSKEDVERIVAARAG